MRSISAIFGLMASLLLVAPAIAGPMDWGSDIFTDGEAIGITDGDAPFAPKQGLLHLENEGNFAAALRARSYWTGSTAAPYVNNDSALIEVMNNVTSNSGNRSWAGSFANANNNIPYGVTDSGERTGILGWAVSVSGGAWGYYHAGTLERQTGVSGTAGFQGAGSPSTGVVNNAVGVRGYIYNDSAGATINSARAGEFMSGASTGTVKTNVAVYASAAYGTLSNYSFFGEHGKFFNADQVLVKNESTQSGSYVAARSPGNAFEFGHPDPAGYGSNIGATYSAGWPFLAFNAEADPSGNTFRTRGKPGVVISSDLAGSLIFSRVPQSNNYGQALLESGRFNTRGNLVLSSNPPASSSSVCQTGEHAWDANYTYVCVSANNWKRAALSSW